MNRFWLAAAAAGILTAACSGHGAAPNALPAAPQAQAPSKSSAPIAPAGWSATATRGFPGVNMSANETMVSPSQMITVHVGLALRNVRQLEGVIRSRQILTPAAFARTYGPTPDRVNAVEAYLRKQGFTHVHADPNGLLVHGTAPRRDVERAFGTHIAGIARGGRTYYANATPAYVPREFAGTIAAVLGLHDVPTMHAGPKRLSGPNRHPGPTPSPSPTPTPEPSAQPCTANEQGVCPRFYDPPSFQIAYDAATAPTAANTSIAIMTEGNLTTAISDFRLNEQKFGLKPASITIVQAEPASSDTSGDTEWTLDMTYSTGIAAVVKNLYLYNFASLTDADVVVGYNKWVTDDVAPIANSSFGGCEVFAYQDGSMLMGDEILNQAAAQGQTMFASSGDNGGYCNNLVDTNGAPGGAPMVEWPAASPYVVAVGGTDLFSNPDGTYLGETAWEAGGGGLSQFEYSPYWESGVQPVSSTPAGLSFRGVPDVAMDASLETGALLWTSSPAVNGSCTPCTTGGTSLASPLAAGSYARMQSAHGNALGFAAIAFYDIYNANPTASETTVVPATQLVGGFHDVLSGSNGLYTALQRYDYTTGLGSIDVAKTNAIIR